MKKVIFGLLMLAVGFLMYFSVFRALTGSEPLTLQAFLQKLNILDFEFDTAYEYYELTFNDWQQYVATFQKPFSGIDGSTIWSFFSSIGAFFEQIGIKFLALCQMIGTAFVILFGFLFDFIEVFVSFIELILSLLGIIPTP